MTTPQINLDELKTFLVKAKKATYARDGREVTPERPGFKELEYIDGLWAYRDSYTGFYAAPGQEVVRFNGTPVWAMAYCGGMFPQFNGNLGFARATFAFLKEALSQVSEDIPARGPEFLRDEDWIYENHIRGDIADFDGLEVIRREDMPVFSQRYIGGLIIGK